MTATIFDIKRFAVHDGDGIRTTVFFKGCPLRCLWCHNPEGLERPRELALFSHLCVGCGACAGVCRNGVHSLSDGVHSLDRSACAFCGECVKVCPNDALKIYGREVTVADLLPDLLADRPFYEASGGGVTLSGGECLLQADFCAELLAALKKEGIRTAVDTCGCVPRENIEKVLPLSDVFLYDVKAIDPAVHRRATGLDNRLILDNLRFLDESGAETEVRIPFVPGYNDGEIPAIAAYLKTLRHLRAVRVLPYHNYAASKYAALGRKADLPPDLPTEEMLDGAEKVLSDAGIRVISRK